MVYSTVNDSAKTIPHETCSQTHDLKIGPKYFVAVSVGKKKFELRKNDRDFKVGDQLILREWNDSEYTGRSLHCEVDYILSGHDGLDPDYVILSITLL